MTESRGYAYPRKIIWRKDGKWVQRFDVEVTEPHPTRGGCKYLRTEYEWHEIGNPWRPVHVVINVICAFLAVVFVGFAISCGSLPMLLLLLIPAVGWLDALVSINTEGPWNYDC
jgi:hypothetical protein